MSSEKQPLGNTNDQAKQVFYAIGREAAKISIIGPTVAACLLPGDLILHLLHTKKPGESINFLKGTMYVSFFKGMTSAYKNSAVAATKKNSIYTQRENVNEVIGNKKENNSNEEPTSGSTKKNSLYAPIAAAVVLGLADTTLTQRNSNYKTWSLESAKQGINLVPAPKTFSERFKVFWVGYPLRAVKNINIVAGLIFQPLLKDKLTPVMPNKNPETSHAVSSFLSGIVTGLFANVLERFYKNQVVQFDTKTFKAPSAYKNIKNLLATQGVRSLGNGAVVSMAYSVAAQYVVPKAEQFAEKAVTQVEKAWSNSTFFSKAPETTEMKAPQVVEQENTSGPSQKI